MSKFGLYAINEQKKAGSSTWNLSRLYHDGKDIATVSDPDSFGLRSVDSKLNLGGAVIAESEDAYPNLGVNNGDIKFGDDVSLGTGKCINITLDDFNILLQGGSASGYTKYNPSACYNIVDDVATAEEVTWQPSEYDLNDPIFCKHYHIYNNIVGMDDVYEEYGGPIDALHPVNTFTAISTEDNLDGGCPKIGFHYFENVISADEHLHIQFHVDTHNMAFFNGNTIGEKFTTTIKDENGNIIAQRTTYAGIIRMDIPPYDNNGESWNTGNHWFSIQTVDSRGVGSVVDYYDFRVKTDYDEELEEATDPNIRKSSPLVYEATLEDLSTFNIIPGDSQGEQPYRNKLGLSLLFSAVKNSLVDVNSDSPYYGMHYMGIRLPALDTPIYCDYRRNKNIGIFTGDEVKNGSNVRINTLITLDTASEYETLIKETPIRVGCCTTFLFHIYKDPTYYNSDGTVKQGYIQATNGGTSDILDGVVYDPNTAKFIVAKKYKIAPLISGMPVVYIGGDDTDVVDNDTLDYNYQEHTANPYSAGMLSYYYFHDADICSGNIETLLSDLISSAIDNNTADYYNYSYEDNGNTITVDSVTIPQDVEPLEWVYRDGAHIYRKESDPNTILFRLIHNNANHGEYVWPSTHEWSQSELPNYEHTDRSSLTLKTISYWHYVNPAENAGKANISATANGRTVSITIPLWQYYAAGSTFYIVANNNPWSNGTGKGYENRTQMRLPTSDFYIDLNGCTLKGTNSEYIRIAYPLLSIYNANNVHIKNGKIDGGYREHNWLKSYFLNNSGSHGQPTERIQSINFWDCTFCSFDNMEVGYTLGYNGSSVSTRQTSFPFYNKFNNAGYIDFSGNVNNDGKSLEHILPPPVEKEISDYRRAKLSGGNVVEDVLTDRNPHVGLVYTSDFRTVPYEGNVYADDLIIRCGIDSVFHDAKRPEMFIYFYNESNELINIVKTEPYVRFKAPAGATKYKVTAYGVTIEDGGTRDISISYTNGGTAVPQSFNYSYLVSIAVGGHNNIYNNVVWHNTATTVTLADATFGTTYKDCNFFRTSTLHDLSDNGWGTGLEEGEQSRGQTSLICCKYRNGTDVPSEYIPSADDFKYFYPGELKGGNCGMYIYACRNLTLADVDNVYIWDHGGLRNSYLFNNIFKSLEIDFSFYTSHKSNILVENSIGEGKYNTSSSNQLEWSGNNTLRSSGNNVYYEPNRKNRDDDPLEPAISILGTFAHVSSSDSSKYNILNGSLKNNSGITKQALSSDSISNITLVTQAGKLHSGLGGNLAKYNGFREKMENGNIGEYGSENIGGYNAPVITDANMVTIEENFSNYRHTTLMLDVSQCTVTGVTTDSGETLSIFCYDENGAFIKVVNSVSAITNDVKYIKLQTELASGYTSTKPIRVSVKGNVKLCKNSVPALLEYTPFRFETSIPVTDDAVENCELTYNKNTRCMDTGVVVMPPNYSIKGEPVPLVLFLHGTTDANEFLTRPLNGEHYLVSQFLARNGYAVADCSGITNLYYDRYSTAKGEGIAAPSYILALQNLVKYIFANYNVKTDGVYLSCKSIGGIPAMLLLQKQPFKIKSVGMLAPALSPIISLSNHARKLTDSANMEAEQLGINYTFVADRFNADDKASIINNMSIWRKIDGFFEGTDLTDAQVQTVVSNSHGATTDSVFSLIIGKADGTVGQQSNWNTLVAKQYHTDVPVRVWISEGDNAVHYCNSQLFVKMAENGDCDCTLRIMDALSAYGTSSASTESHNVCTIAHGAPKITSYTTRLGTTITSFNGKSGVPKGICELVNWFNNGSKEEL